MFSFEIYQMTLVYNVPYKVNINLVSKYGLALCAVVSHYHPLLVLCVLRNRLWGKGPITKNVYLSLVPGIHKERLNFQSCPLTNLHWLIKLWHMHVTRYTTK